MTYSLTVAEHPTYLHTTVTGESTAENALRFLRESHEACMARGISSVLLEMNLQGSSIDTGSIYSVISQRSDTGKQLRKIAYVDTSSHGMAKARFAETVAVNRGVNVRLFKTVPDAKRWLEE